MWLNLLKMARAQQQVDLRQVFANYPVSLQ